MTPTMTSTPVRVYAVVAAALVFLVSWAVVAAHPWQTRTAAADPNLHTLQVLRARLQRQSLEVQRILDRRWAAYHAALRERQRTIAIVKALGGGAAAAAAAPAAPAAPAAAAPLVAAPAVPAVPVVATRTS